MIKPLHDLVVVRRTATAPLKGGILLTIEEKRCDGEVLAFGPKATDLKVGDNVLFPKYAGMELAIEGEDLLMLKATDLLGVLNEQS